MFNDILVPMPESRALFRLHPNGSTYVYYTVAAYRNKAGNPTSKVKAIGKKDEKTKQLIPNKNYYIIFKKEDEMPVVEKKTSSTSKKGTI